MATTTKTGVSRLEASPPKKSDAPQPIAATTARKMAVIPDPHTSDDSPAKVRSPGKAYQQKPLCW